MMDSMVALNVTSPGIAVARGVTLEQVLANRDRRVARQHDALAEHGKPLLSLTLVTPGPVKDSADARFLLQVAIESIDAMAAARKWRVLGAEVLTAPTGPEALYTLDCDACDLKRALTHLEDRHALGRLWDMDVICPQQGSISRRSLGLVPRACLLCSEPAHACARSRAHPLVALTEAVEKRIHEYRSRSVA